MLGVMEEAVVTLSASGNWTIPGLAVSQHVSRRETAVAELGISNYLPSLDKVHVLEGFTCEKTVFFFIAGWT